MPLYAAPIADVTRVNWITQAGGTANLWSGLDESPPDDADFVQTTNTAPTSDILEVRLAPVLPPLIRRGHILRVRARKNQALGNQRGIVVQLRQGANLLIAENSNPDLTALWPTLPFTLTPQQAALITDYSDLRVRMWPTGATGGSGAARRSVQVSFVQLRVPDSTFGAVEDVSEPGVWKYTLNGVTGQGPTKEDALVDLFDKLRDINGAIEEPDASQLAERALLGNRWAYLYYARKIRDYTTLRAQIADGSYVLPPHQNIPEELINVDEKLARFDAITSAADTQDGG